MTSKIWREGVWSIVAKRELGSWNHILAWHHLGMTTNYNLKKFGTHFWIANIQAWKLGSLGSISYKLAVLVSILQVSKPKVTPYIWYLKLASLVRRPLDPDYVPGWVGETEKGLGDFFDIYFTLYRNFSTIT